MKKQYVNEHMLAVMMSAFRNYDGRDPVKMLRNPEQKIIRANFVLARALYEASLAENSKQNQQVQQAFKSMLELSTRLYPSNEEIQELHNMIRLMAEKCVRTFGGYSLDVDDVASIAFERWLKYKYNFDPTKRSEITNQRVNSFSYMTQLIKNVIYELNNKRSKIETYEFNETAIDPEFAETVLGGGTSGLLETEEIPKTPDSEILDAIIKYENKCSDLSEYLKSVARDTKIDPEEIIEVICAYNLLPHLKLVVQKNRWEF